MVFSPNVVPAKTCAPDSLLIEHNADVGAQRSDDRIPLCGTAPGGGVDTTPPSLELGVDVDAQDGDRRTPLHGAAKYGYLDVTRPPGADMNAQAKGWKNSTLWHRAS